ncbi:multidrug resistance ABC transporter ATP-binding/permease protein BmrA [Lachnospiraceae bacterium]|nr:multidrug resistance ABC transporter ATP-binding/permease protein BmrA [Lachnospiraceae bacterium]
MERVFGKDRGSMGRFFRMLQKARLPYLWILAYIAITALLTNVGISVTEYTAELFAGNVNFGTVVLPFLAFTLLSQLIGSVSKIMSNLCVARIDRNIRKMIWSKTVRLPLRYYEKNKPKEMISRITTDITAISQLIMQVFVAILTSAYTLVITLGKIGSYDQKLMIALIAVLPLNLVIAFVMGKMKFGVLDLVNQKNAELTQTIAEKTNNLLLIKSYGKEEKELQTGQEKMKGFYKSSILNAWLGFATPMYALVGAMQFIVIVMVGRSFYSSGALTLTQWIAYYGFAVNIVNQLSAYCVYWTTFKGSQGATRRVAQIMEEMEEDIENGEHVEHLCGDIELREVDFSYEDKLLFDKLNLKIPAGRVTALIGPSGSGKTTLLNLVERMYPVSGGKILFGGEDTARYSLKSFRSEISYVTQESTLFAGTIRDNILFGIKREVTDEELEKVCTDAEIMDFIREQPEGFLADVGEQGEKLSGGQKQRIAFARALLKQSDYLFMDEATAAMDIRGKDQVWKSVKRHMEGKTVLMVAHDRQTVQKADYIIVMHNGKIICQGEPAEVYAENTYYRELIGSEGQGR